MTILAIAAGVVLASGTWSGQSHGTWDVGPKQPQRPIYGAPTPQPKRAAPSYGSEFGGGFKPGTSVYSGRGGVNGYPSAPKPKGYINPYGR